ncbi:MAG: hypothetical protein CVU44_13430 [Chloroflexi bacterium HGW-Chloroflexi-6]|nr:MAG: hypothetical protein CVU44_13430 [Chloroflexi bacterium HGW-Chloroflexi-6]
MSDSVRNQIYSNLNQKTTDELLEIWVSNDQAEWSELTFELIEQLLLEREMEVPAQNQAILSHDQEPKEESDPNTEDEQDGPVFYKTEAVFRIIKWLELASIASLIVIPAWSMLLFLDLINNMLNTFNIGILLLGVIAAIVAFAISVLGAIMIYLSLRATAYILKILMEFEHNSRGVK